MLRLLPPQPSLEHARHEAKALVRAARSGDPAAVSRIHASHPRAAQLDLTALKLSDAQWVLAREHGFRSWRALKDRIDALTLTRSAQVSSFVEAACLGSLQRARQLLDADPSLVDSDLVTACITGREETALRLLERQPALAREQLAPRGWPAILYLCHSRFLRDPDRRPTMLRIAERLLELGADPNAWYRDPNWPELPETALYGATGVNDVPDLAQLLLERGANPTDFEALYHSAELPSLACLRVLLAFKPELRGANVLKRKLDYPDPEGVRLLLEAGADPNEYRPNALHHAILRNREGATIRLLLDAGATVDARDPQGLTPYQVAVRRGNSEAAEALAAAGADRSLQPFDAFVGACARADEFEAKRLIQERPKLISLLSSRDAAMLAHMVDAGRYDAVRLMVALGWPLDANGDWNGSPLNHAAWWGEAELVELFLAHGADREQVNGYGGTPLGAAIYGSEHCTDRQGGVTSSGQAGSESHGDYPRCVELLLRSGATPPSQASGTPEVRAVLRRFGVADA